MPLFDGSTVSDGLSKPSNMSGVLGKPTLSYNGSYVMFDPRGRDGEGFSPHWSNSKATLVEGKNPMGHLPDAVGQNHIRQNFPLYANPSEVNSPTASADVRRQKPGCEILSPSFENSVYFARPQPVYRAAHCCNGPGCVMGPPYVVEHGSRMLNSLYEREWMQSGVPYTKMPPIQRQGPDTLLEQRGVPFEPTVDSLNRIHVEPYASNRVRALPVMMEPNFTRYHCAPTLNAPLSDHSHPLQTAPRGYPGLYSHRTYEHMTSELYQDPSSMAKYGQLAHHPVFYCPPANVDAEQRIQCKETSSKQGEDVPAIHKHSIPNSLEHCIVTQSLHGDIPLAFPSTEMLPVHPFMQGFSYPCYAVPRVHSNANQIRSPLKSPHALPVYNYSLLNVSPSRQHKDHPRTSPTSPNKDKSTRDVGQVSSHSPFMYMNQTSPTRRIGQPGTSPSSIQLAKLFPTLAGLTVSPAVLSPVNMNLNRLTDYLPCQAPETCQKRPQSLPLSPSAWLSHTDQTRATPDGPKFQKVIFSPIVATESKHNGSVSFSGSPTHKDSLKRKHSNLSPPIKIKEDLYEGVIRKKLKKSNYQPVGNHTDSPPMPVIDNVFSLAHYLMASRGSSSGEALLRTTQSSDECEGKQENENKKSDPDKKQHNWAVTSKEICPHAPTEKVVDEDFEPLKVKVEKVDPSETDLVEETRINQSECIKVIIKMEPEDAVPPNSNPTNNCESEDLKSEPPSEITKDASVVSEPATFVTNQNSLSQGNVHHLHKPPVPSQADSNHPSPQPEPTKSPHKNPSNSLPYQNILSKDRQPSPCPPDRMPALALNVVVPQQVPQIPVRKHFFALHYSFCKQVSELVSASSEQELKNWLSQQEIGPVTSSTKVQKVTCLLGVKAREVWIKEEMKSKLNDILLRLKEYTAMERCPFPHIMRTGAVFLPMLVVKELLFPTVQGSLVDKVLQEHKVQLRPTTLSEEKILTQLHKRACSSKLRRLMSLRHLPDIYEDVVNLLYYTSVCKHLESTSSDVQNSAQE
ncbi:uncharacterized protein C15orf39 homolog [Gouania willdenowi]|uniref:Uncharacterized protein n=1 Tax=Gouania willdenowi TaxID=441366 RepID=A0A8C5ESK0_GOUWI|nr:uncharacterized protein C15orf39 homolog [Gouania willdenowi]